MEAIEKAAKQYHASTCIECGKCTANCPISRCDRTYSPRLLISKAISGDYRSLISDKKLYECLTCMRCHERCPSDVDYAGFTGELRAIAFSQGYHSECSHGGALQSVMRMMTSPNMKQKRTEWLTPDLKINKTSEVLFFVGCLPYFQEIFANACGATADFKIDPLQIAKSSIKILNKLGIEPTIIDDERCCGHDLLWNGDVENFKKLAQINIEYFKKSGIKEIITACPECRECFHTYYPKFFSGSTAGNGFSIPVKHITELLSEKISSNGVKINAQNIKVTYQDPCRLGRHAKIYEAPRNFIKAVPEVNFLEMPNNKNSAVCCGTTCWSNCGANSKCIQEKRLLEATNTGAELLLTACPKCQIHFSCALKDEQLAKKVKVKIEDFSVFAEKAII